MNDTEVLTAYHEAAVIAYLSGFYSPIGKMRLLGIDTGDNAVMLSKKRTGFRWHKTGERTLLGSLLLGLCGDSGSLEHVGVCASFTAAKRKELIKFLAPYPTNALSLGMSMGGQRGSGIGQRRRPKNGTPLKLIEGTAIHFPRRSSGSGE